MGVAFFIDSKVNLPQVGKEVVHFYQSGSWLAVTIGTVVLKIQGLDVAMTSIPKSGTTDSLFHDVLQPLLVTGDSSIKFIVHLLKASSLFKT